VAYSTTICAARSLALGILDLFLSVHLIRLGEGGGEGQGQGCWVPEKDKAAGCPALRLLDCCERKHFGSVLAVPLPPAACFFLLSGQSTILIFLATPAEIVCS